MGCVAGDARSRDDAKIQREVSGWQPGSVSHLSQPTTNTHLNLQPSHDKHASELQPSHAYPLPSFQPGTTTGQHRLQLLLPSGSFTFKEADGATTCSLASPGRKVFSARQPPTHKTSATFGETALDFMA